MKKFIFYIVMLFSTYNFAHGVDISTIVLTEQEDNTWTLQITSSLDAFRKEIRFHFSDTPYTTPEMFQEQVLSYCINTLKITINNNQNILLDKGYVKLGHETMVYFNAIEIPEDIASLHLDGGLFKDIRGSKVKLLVLKKGFENRPMLLNKKNKYTIDLLLEGNSFRIKGEENKLYKALYIGIAVLTIGLIIFFVLRKLKASRFKVQYRRSK